MLSMTLPQYRRHECTLYDAHGVARTLRMKPQLCELLALLLVSSPHCFVHRHTMIEALWPNPDFEPDWADNLVWMCLTKLRRLGVPIERDWGFGWRIPRWARGTTATRLAA